MLRFLPDLTVHGPKSHGTAPPGGSGTGEGGGCLREVAGGPSPRHRSRQPSPSTDPNSTVTLKREGGANQNEWDSGPDMGLVWEGWPPHPVYSSPTQFPYWWIVLSVFTEKAKL